ncbi:Aldo/keto reductase [Pleurostoma richardsiae]|uniref:Aldo/keto reductase n=1 Tax=Pleurostoma richardsiae TaxID=41990 RepID=A0AA38RQA8_9PEZI|nr:Aldo/keto reductase [Pleurostoma richardsiae]
MMFTKAVPKWLSSLAVVAGFLCAQAAAEQQHRLSVGDIPQFGIGTWQSDRNKVADAIDHALNNGYDHIDSAFIYRNEDETGKGIVDSGVSREDIWVTSKLWNTFHRPSEVRAAAEKSISDLGVDYLDLYLIHWPVAFVPGSGTELDTSTSILDTWRAMEDLVRANLTRYIGVSNFAKADVEALLAEADIRPYAHEFEAHPYLQQQEFVDWHLEEGIKVIAYSPLGNTNPTYDGRGKEVPPLLKDEFWVGVAERKNATVAQAVLAWGLQRGTVVIPRSVNLAHIDENYGAVKISFTEEELQEIAKTDRKARMSNPGKNWGVKLFADLDDPTKLDDEPVEDEL